jgi:glycerophosphoryl diester phosphodiesterase
MLGALGPPSQFKGRKLTDPEKVLNAEFLTAIEETGAELVVWNAAVTRESVDLAHQRNHRVWVYTVDDPAKAKELVKLGVDGIITNDPESIRQALE